MSSAPSKSSDKMKSTAISATSPIPVNPNEVIYFEGDFVPAAKAVIGVKTNGFLYGTSIFEGIRGYYVKDQKAISIFRLKEHYERLIQNGRICYLNPDDLGLSLERLIDLTVTLVQKNNPAEDIYLRPTLYKSGDVITPSLHLTKTEFCVWTRPMGEYLALEKGLNVCVSSWRRIKDNAIPARAKAGGAYMNTALAVTDARLSGYDDTIFLTESGMVSEGSAMNLFLIKDNTLITPSVTQNILEGITRETLMILAKNELGLETVERAIDRTELYCADEAFFCGTGAQVAPITMIDRRPVGDGAIGEISRKLQDIYFDVVKAQMPKYKDWCTLVPVG